jgi:hypothetical protein
MSRYQILIADPLLGMGLQFPDGTALAGVAGPGLVGTHWHWLEDPAAPADLDGRQVEIRLRRDSDGKPVIDSRRLILTHLCPQGDGGLLACCDLPVWEMPHADRITEDKEDVTCGGAS